MEQINNFEQEVKENLLNAFIYDLVFSNPQIINSNKEFCDLLIHFFGDYLLIQCKECKLEDEERLTKNTIFDGLNQLRATVNRARNKQVQVFNEIQGEKIYDFSDLKQIYPILVVNKKVPFISYNYLREKYPKLNKLGFIPIIIDIEDLRFILSELDTPKDLFDYFQKREDVIATDRIWCENERELFSYYMLNIRSFNSDKIPPKSQVILNDLIGVYQKGEIGKLFKRKKKLEKVSYWVDSLLRRMFLGGEKEYLKACEILIKLNRVERRVLAENAMEKSAKAYKEYKDTWRLFKFSADDDVVYVMFFSRKSLKKRNENLMRIAVMGKYQTNSKKVFGIAQEPVESKDKYSVTFDSIMFLEGDEYLKYLQKNILDEGLKYTFGQPYTKNFSEFPDSITSGKNKSENKS